jgi:hypothetical protein
MKRPPRTRTGCSLEAAILKASIDIWLNVPTLALRTQVRQLEQRFELVRDRLAEVEGLLAEMRPMPAVPRATPSVHERGARDPADKLARDPQRERGPSQMPQADLLNSRRDDRDHEGEDQ